jgi:RND family efflux transporter MFP subunit
MKRFVLLLCVWGCGGAKSQPETRAPSQAPLPTGNAAMSPFSMEGYVGVVSAKNSAVVTAAIEARVQEVYVQMGAWVEKDAPIAKLDDATISQQALSMHGAAEAASANLRRAKLTLAEARRQLRIEERLVAQGVSPRASMLSAQTAVAQAQAGAVEAEARLASAEADAAAVAQRLSSATLRAPMAGHVSVLRARPGDMVTPGQLIVRVTDSREVAIRFAIPAEDADKLKVTQRITFVSGDVTLSGQVRDMARDLEPPLQLIVAEASIEDHAGPMPQPGLVGTVELVNGRKRQ